MDNATTQEKDNATSRKEVEVAVDNAFYVIKHYYYTLLNDNVARERDEQEGRKPKTAETFEQAKEQLQNHREQQPLIERLLVQAETLKSMLDDDEGITYRKDSEPYSD